LFPIKHVILYKWRFREARSLSELRERLERSHFYTISPRRGMLVATSRSKPSAVIFVFTQEGDEGGELLLIQTPLGYYTLEHIRRSMRVFARIAGIDVEEQAKSSGGM